jgi:hypothetical protein
MVDFRSLLNGLAVLPRRGQSVEEQPHPRTQSLIIYDSQVNQSFVIVPISTPDQNSRNEKYIQTSIPD